LELDDVEDSPEWWRISVVCIVGLVRAGVIRRSDQFLFQISVIVDT